MLEKYNIIDFASFKNSKNNAQELVYDAWETQSRRKRISLAKKALKIDPLCTDAFNILAEDEADTIEDECQYFKAGIEAFEKKYGKGYFNKNKGYFWGLIETRPYMRACAGLAECLWKMNKKEKAIELYKKMLRLNPNDNQGIRYNLLCWLYLEDRDDELKKLLKKYGEYSTFFLYTSALYLFKTKDKRALRQLKRAYKSNPFIVSYITGENKLPKRIPGYYSTGSKEEAIIYVSDNKKCWQKTYNAIVWIKESI
ncbi:tetratricopeptide repeat protein [bacterium]|nr:tetratricopeptide repeat protein [bacterium]